MWEIENNPDVLCIGKDETAEEFLCDAYGVVKPTTLSSAVIEEPKKCENAVSTAATNQISAIEKTKTAVIVAEAKTTNKSEAVKVVATKGNLIENLEFSDADSEDMTPIYSKLITITGSRDASANGDKPDSSSGNPEAEAASIPPSGSTNGWPAVRPCSVVLHRLSQVEINRALRVAPEYGPSAQLLSQECVKTINQEPRVIDTIIIDGDDDPVNVAAVVLAHPERVPLPIPSSASDLMPKSRQILIPRWPKPLFEKSTEKSVNPLATKKTISGGMVKSKERKERQQEVAKKTKKEAPLSFDNLFNKGFNVLGSGLKISKKASAVPAVVPVVEEARKDVLDVGDDIILELEPPTPPTTPDKKEAIVRRRPVPKKERRDGNDDDDEDLEAAKWCRAQNWGNDEPDDFAEMADFVENDDEDDHVAMETVDVKVAPEATGDGDDESNTSWGNGGRSPGSPPAGTDRDEDADFLAMVDTTRRRRQDGHHRDGLEGPPQEAQQADDDDDDGGEDARWCEVDRIQSSPPPAAKQEPIVHHQSASYGFASNGRPPVYGFEGAAIHQQQRDPRVPPASVTMATNVQSRQQPQQPPTQQQQQTESFDVWRRLIESKRREQLQQGRAATRLPSPGMFPPRYPSMHPRYDPAFLARFYPQLFLGRPPFLRPGFLRPAPYTPASPDPTGDDRPSFMYTPASPDPEDRSSGVTVVKAEPPEGPASPIAAS